LVQFPVAGATGGFFSNYVQFGCASLPHPPPPPNFLSKSVELLGHLDVAPSLINNASFAFNPPYSPTAWYPGTGINCYKIVHSPVERVFFSRISDYVTRIIELICTKYTSNNILYTAFWNYRVLWVTAQFLF
jgi:hypothetical protein